MPFKSKAQERLFWADPKLRKYAQRWADETQNIRRLPDHARKSSMRKGSRHMMISKFVSKHGR
jgi:hypothetical protein